MTGGRHGATDFALKRSGRVAGMTLARSLASGMTDTGLQASPGVWPLLMDGSGVAFTVFFATNAAVELAPPKNGQKLPLA